VADEESDTLALEVLAVAFQRQAASKELASLGIEASPADVSAWLAADRKTRERLGRASAALSLEPEPLWKSRKGVHEQ
jgi:hypothetical protein